MKIMGARVVVLLALLARLVQSTRPDLYRVLEVDRTASQAHLRKAYYRLSMRFHPDKAHDTEREQAHDRFIEVARAYEILSDPDQRTRYDALLARRESHLGSVPLSMEEKTWFEDWDVEEVVEELFEDVSGRRFRDPYDLYDDFFAADIETSLWEDIVDNTGLLLATFLLGSVSMGLIPFCAWLKKKGEEAGVVPRLRLRRLRRERRTPQDDDRLVTDLRAEPVSSHPCVADEPVYPKKLSGAPWSDEELELLIGSVKKYPGGTRNRWEKIAQVVRTRSPEECATRATTLKKLEIQGPPSCPSPPTESGSQIPPPRDAQDIAYQRFLLTKTRKKERRREITSPPTERDEEATEPHSDDRSKNQWTSQQQQHLEAALRMYPTGTPNRWDRIADCVPRKSKDECMTRFKQLAALVRQQRTSQGL